VSVSIDHTHDINGEFSDGVFTVASGGANFNGASKSYNFDVRTTSWFKSEMQKTADAVIASVRSAFSGSITTTGNISCSAGSGSKSGTARASASVGCAISRTVSGSTAYASWSTSVTMTGSWHGSDSDGWTCTANHRVATGNKITET